MVLMLFTKLAHILLFLKFFGVVHQAQMHQFCHYLSPRAAAVAK